MHALHPQDLILVALLPQHHTIWIAVLVAVLFAEEPVLLIVVSEAPL